MKARYALAACAALLMGASAVRADQAADKKSIQAFYDKYAAAVKKKDYGAIEKMILPDAKLKQKNGQVMSGKQSLQMMKQVLPMMNLKEFTTHVKSVAVKGDTATVQISQTMEGSITAQGATHTMKSTEDSKDTLKRKGASWVLAAEDTLSDSTTMDGKPFPPPGGAAPGGGK